MRFITYARKSIIKPILLRFFNERQIIKLHFIYKRSLRNFRISAFICKVCCSKCVCALGIAPKFHGGGGITN